MQHPIAHPVAIAFLVEEEAKFKTEVEAAANETKAKKTSNWIDNDPFLHLYHCLINDKVKAAFLDHGNALNHENWMQGTRTKGPRLWSMRQESSLMTQLLLLPLFTCPLSIQISTSLKSSALRTCLASSLLKKSSHEWPTPGPSSWQ
jgi:hypothetical protein